MDTESITGAGHRAGEDPDEAALRIAHATASLGVDPLGLNGESSGEMRPRRGDET